jgi:intracellular multiplication protein IcmV
MKKKSSSRVGKVFSRIINIRFWFDWERMKTFTFFVGEGLRRLFMMEQNDEINKDEPALTESFNNVQQQLNLTDEDLLKRQKALLRLSILMTVIAFFIFLYSGYHFYKGSIWAGILSLVVMMIAAALAFRYHFWYYQIKSRKLGCSIYEWYRKGLLGAKE